MNPSINLRPLTAGGPASFRQYRRLAMLLDGADAGASEVYPLRVDVDDDFRPRPYTAGGRSPLPVATTFDIVERLVRGRVTITGALSAAEAAGADASVVDAELVRELQAAQGAFRQSRIEAAKGRKASSSLGQHLRDLEVDRAIRAVGRGTPQDGIRERLFACGLRGKPETVQHVMAIQSLMRGLYEFWSPSIITELMADDGALKGAGYGALLLEEHGVPMSLEGWQTMQGTEAERVWRADPSFEVPTEGLPFARSDLPAWVQEIEAAAIERMGARARAS